MQAYIFDESIFYDSEPESRVPGNAVSIYEVVKVVDGIPLFLEEHLKRLKHSSDILGLKIHVDDAQINRQIYQLIEINHICRGRIKFVIAFHHENNHFYLLQAEDIEPAPELYQSGVRIKSIRIERQNPEAKIIQKDYNKVVSDALKDQSIFEVLLVKGDGKVTECSRANIFFIKSSDLYTAFAKDVLSGITRAKVYSLAESLGLKVVETDIHIDDLAEYESAFITGTSPGVLPVSQIDDVVFSVAHPTLQALSQSYSSEVIAYIKAKKH